MVNWLIVIFWLLTRRHDHTLPISNHRNNKIIAHIMDAMVIRNREIQSVHVIVLHSAKNDMNIMIYRPYSYWF